MVGGASFWRKQRENCIAIRRRDCYPTAKFEPSIGYNAEPKLIDIEFHASVEVSNEHIGFEDTEILTLLPESKSSGLCQLACTLPVRGVRGFWAQFNPPSGYERTDAGVHLTVGKLRYTLPPKRDSRLMRIIRRSAWLS